MCTTKFQVSHGKMREKKKFTLARYEYIKRKKSIDSKGMFDSQNIYIKGKKPKGKIKEKKKF